MNNKPHLFAELLALMKNNDLSRMDINDFIKLEWANAEFFGSIEGLTFPSFKNKDKFEWIKSYAADKFASSMFSVQFDSITKTLARNVWASLISDQFAIVSRSINTKGDVDEVIINCINILSECDKNVIQDYINKIVDYYAGFEHGRIDQRLGIDQMMGGYAGGNIGTEIRKVDIDKYTC